MKDRKIWDEIMKWKDSIWEAECPFCHTSEWEQRLEIKKFKFWKLVKNLYPYSWLKNHLLLIPYRHIEHTKFLNNEELSELSEIYNFIEKFFWDENYFSFIRETNWWKSIKHIHYHYLPWILYSQSVEKMLDEQLKK